MGFIENQVKAEVKAAKKVIRWYSYVLVVFWGILGLIFLVGPGWPLGLIFIGGAVYTGSRLKKSRPSPIENR